MHNKILIIAAIITIVFSIWGVHTAYQERNDIKFSKDADIYDTPLNEMDSIEMLSDRSPSTKLEVRWIVIHCTASQDGKYMTLNELDRIFKERGFSRGGYHAIINYNGDDLWTAKLDKPYLLPKDVRYGVAGYNSHCVHLSWVGGYKGKDTKTKAQDNKLIQIIKKLKELYPKAQVVGHTDFPKVSKSCPNFSVKSWVELHKDELN